MPKGVGLVLPDADLLRRYAAGCQWTGSFLTVITTIRTSTTYVRTSRSTDNSPIQLSAAAFLEVRLRLPHDGEIARGSNKVAVVRDTVPWPWRITM